MPLNTDLENRVARRTAELRAANEALDAFSYFVSHNLRSQLSAIEGFSLMRRKTGGDKISAKGQHHLPRIRSGTQHVSELIVGPTGTPVYGVKDNGAGFDMAFSAKLFAIFEQPHAGSDFFRHRGGAGDCQTCR